tara:strand:+ start:2136 stop:2483 length:348 start_codon:yes stop_codon:yes gene_type:complete
MKGYIKKLVKESLGGLLKEKGKVPAKDKDDKDVKKKKAVEKNLDQQDQTDIYNAAHSELAPPMSAIMSAAGLGNPDDAGDRSTFVKKINQKHDAGFTKLEKTAVSKVTSQIDTGS